MALAPSSAERPTRAHMASFCALSRSTSRYSSPSRAGRCHSDAQERPQQQMRRPGEPRRRPIRTQYFGDVDVDAPLLKPGVGTGPEDYTKRSKNRYDSDFIWNTNWMDKAKEDVEKAGEVQQIESAQGPANEAGSGFLSLSRVNDLNDMSVDLSAKLQQKPKPLLPKSYPSISMTGKVQPGKKYSDPPSTREGQSWQRSSGYKKRGAIGARLAAGDIDEDNTQAKEEEERLAYESMKQQYQLWTTATTVFCFAAVCAFYTRDVAASYLIGALGGIFYLRMLTRSVDSIGASTLGATAGGAAAQPRFLIPVILVLVYNRYNLLYAESVDLQLQLLPMLAGFFTYKVAVLDLGVQCVTSVTCLSVPLSSDRVPLWDRFLIKPMFAHWAISLSGMGDLVRAL